MLSVDAHLPRESTPLCGPEPPDLEIYSQIFTRLVTCLQYATYNRLQLALAVYA